MASPNPVAQKSKKTRDFLAGQLLIAMPNMTDPRFERTVLIVCSHDEHHALAVILNKPLAHVEFGELLEQLSIDPREGIGGDPVYFGGPVHTSRGLVLHSLDYRREETLEVAPGVGMTATREVLVDIGGRGAAGPRPARHLLAVGYAGWSGGQLEDELAMNAWAHCAAEADIVFAPDPERSWAKALARLGVTGAMLSPEWAARDFDSPLN
ncbi:MAG: YqgE/AlgH family protein [Amphiplicatus sp.]